jgi:hypothetical protein
MTGAAHRYAAILKPHQRPSHEFPLDANPQMMKKDGPIENSRR